MLEKQHLSDLRIVDCLKTNYGIQVTKLTCLPLGADMQASVYKAQTYDQSSYFVKIKHGHGQNVSTAILELLQEAGIQQIIPLIKTIHGQSTQSIDDNTLMVYPFIEGQDGFSRDLTDTQWTALGKVMRKIHNIKVPLSIQAMIPRESYGPKWREVVRSIYEHMESDTHTDEIGLKVRALMKSKSGTIHRLVDRAEQLAQKIQEQKPEFVLCHSDLHGGNVLMDGNDNLHIVDWDAPIMAPKERDLMFIGGGVANVWNKLHEEEWFYKGYGKTEVNPAILAYYRHERIVEDIAVYGQQLLLTTTGGQDRMESYQQFLAQFDPNGVVEIALKTDAQPFS